MPEQSAYESIAELLKTLYAEPQQGDLFFHYTSIAAMQSIVAEQSLRASEIHYFSDAAELGHFASLLDQALRERREAGDGIASALSRWLKSRLLDGHQVFVVSFTIQGNLLSQWRAYCPAGKGVSLGFGPQRILMASRAQGFSVGQCIYDPDQQRQIAAQVVEEILAKSVADGTNPKRPASDVYVSVFQEFEHSLLRVGALFKHPAFSEELEWRAVSPVIVNYRESDIRYREGISTLVPYVPFNLSIPGAEAYLDTVVVGPTPHPNLSINSISRFMSRSGRRIGVFNSQIPYRTW
jgi:hypothetical protein